MCNDWRINCGFYINICCFISNFRPVVNFNYVSSPKYVQKIVLMSAACLAYQSFRSFLKLSNKQHMGPFYALTCKTECLQILYKYSNNWISVPNIVHQLTLTLRCKYSRSNFQDAINSIRRSAAASDCKPMTSVFYDVIRVESIRGHSNMLIEGHFWRFLGNLNPKMLSAIVWTPKRHFLTSQRVFWTIMREIPCTG